MDKSMGDPEMYNEKDRTPHRECFRDSSARLPKLWNDSSEEGTKYLSTCIQKDVSPVHKENETETDIHTDDETKIDQDFLTCTTLPACGNKLSPKVFSRLYTVLDNVKDSHSGKVNTVESQTQDIGTEKPKRVRWRKGSTAAASSKPHCRRSHDKDLGTRSKQIENDDGEIGIPKSSSRNILNRMGKSLTLILARPFKEKKDATDKKPKIQKSDVQKETKF